MCLSFLTKHQITIVPVPPICWSIILKQVYPIGPTVAKMVLCPAQVSKECVKSLPDRCAWEGRHAQMPVRWVVLGDDEEESECGWRVCE